MNERGYFSNKVLLLPIIRYFCSDMIFITGGTGIIGSHLLVEVTKGNEPIKAIYRNINKINNVKKTFKHYIGAQWETHFNKIEWKHCDILDIVTLEEEMQGAKFVYHCAALVSFRRRDFKQLIDVNRRGTANIVNLCLDNNIAKLCHVSSTAAIGKPVKELNRSLNENEKWNPDVEVSGYSNSKYMAEKEVWRGIEEGLDAVIVNPSVVFGYGDWNESSLTIFKTIDKGLKFYPPGANAFVDARDVTLIMTKLMRSDISGERYLCIGENASFEKMLSSIAIGLNKKPPTIKVGKILMGLAWRIAWLRSMFTKKPASLTKESVSSSFGKTSYSAEKLEKAINFKFRKLEEMVENGVKAKNQFN